MASQQQLNLDGDFRIAGEHAMWAGVLAAAIEDYKAELEYIKRRKEQTHPVHFWEIRKIRNFISTEWCEHICDFVGLAPSKLRKRLDELDREFGLEFAS